MATIDDVYDLLVIVDGKVDAIKAKTDQLVFTGGKVEAITDGASSTTLIDPDIIDFPESDYP